MVIWRTFAAASFVLSRIELQLYPTKARPGNISVADDQTNRLLIDVVFISASSLSFAKIEKTVQFCHSGFDFGSEFAMQ